MGLQEKDKEREDALKFLLTRSARFGIFVRARFEKTRTLIDNEKICIN